MPRSGLGLALGLMVQVRTNRPRAKPKPLLPPTHKARYSQRVAQGPIQRCARIDATIPTTNTPLASTCIGCGQWPCTTNA